MPIYYRSKLNWIARYVANKDVLDLGCVDHELDIKDPPWLHGFLKDHAGRVVGVDILPDAIAELERRGYDVVCADVESMDLGEQFDVIVAATSSNTCPIQASLFIVPGPT